jgi:hypothetical protein
MPRVVPSQVVSFISKISPTSGPNNLTRMNGIGQAKLSAVVDLVDRIPDELITVDGDAYAILIGAKALINEMVSTWRANWTANSKLQDFLLHDLQNPLMQIREVLSRCPDEAPMPGTSELGFIGDIELRTNLRNDIGAINRALSNGEWKAATVLAGSAAEALLLWALEQVPMATISGAISTLLASKVFTSRPEANLERWNLHEYLEVSSALNIIKPNTATQARLARNFRNFIHPGVAQRLGEKCDRATALSAVAGMEHVVRDLTP